VHIDLWQVMKEGTGTKTGSTKALMGGIKEWQTSFNTTWLTIHSFIHSFFYGFEQASQILFLL
jgi:hypothetical protein